MQGEAETPLEQVQQQVQLQEQQQVQMQEQQQQQQQQQQQEQHLPSLVVSPVGLATEVGTSAADVEEAVAGHPHVANNFVCSQDKDHIPSSL